MFSDDEIEREYQKAMQEQTSGDKRPDFQSGLLVFMATLALFAVILFAGIKLADMLDYKPEPLPIVPPDKTDIWIFAKIVVTKVLKNPAGASFGGLAEWQSADKCVTKLPNGNYEVKGFVDGTNEFNATLRKRFTLTLRQDEKGELRIVDGPNFE